MVVCAATVSAAPVLNYDGPLVGDSLITGAGAVTQDAKPRPIQRGTGLDGGARAASAFGWAFAGNAFVSGVGVSRGVGGVDLAAGTYSPFAVDLSLPAPGFRWTVGRTYNTRQAASSGGSPVQHDSNGYQGRNWFQASQPEVSFVDGSSDAEDLVIIVYGADRMLEFKRVDGSSSVYRGINGAAGYVDEIPAGSGEPQLFVYYDQHGTKSTFFGDNGSPYEAGDWKLWKTEDPAGNTAYVGHQTTASTAVSSGFNADGSVLLAYDTAGRKYSYAYTTIDGDSRLTQVKAEWHNGAAWVEVGKVEYAYYSTGDDTYGDAGCLKLVTVTTPLTDSGVNSVAKTYYRYWKGAYNASTNPGYPYGVQYVVEAEGYRRADWAGDSTFDNDPLTMNESALKPYATMYFEYDSSRRVNETWSNGQCGCSGAPNGVTTIAYSDNGSFSDDPDGYDTAWKSRAVVGRPDGSFLTQYFDEAGQPLSRVISSGDPGSAPGTIWATQVTRNASGVVTSMKSPAKTATYTHSSGAFTDNSDGLVTPFSVSPGDTDLAGFETERKADTGSAVNLRTREYTSATLTVDSQTLKRPLTSWTRDYETDVTYHQTTLSTTMHSGAAALMPKRIETTWPTVTTGKNGSNAADVSRRYLRKDGTLAFSEAADGVFTYTQYSNGQLVKRIEDAQTNHGSDFAAGDDPNTQFGVTENANGLRRVTSYTYDKQGRPDETTLPDGRVTKQYYSKLADGRLVTVSIPKYVSGSGTFHGPASYTVRNLAGQTEAQGTIAISGGTTTTALTGWIDEGDADLITALDHGSLASLTVNLFDATGTRLEEARSYFDIPASGFGADGTNFDATLFGYDSMGRRWRTKTADGTISRTVFDKMGRVTESWAGRNDFSFTGGEGSGPDDMVKVQATVYDANSNVTSRTQFVQGSTTGQRVTTYAYDDRNRLITESRPAAPHAAYAYDNLGRRTASASYSSLASFDPATDTPTSEAANRLTLSETFYDERGRVWKGIRHEVIQSNGALGSSLTSLTWFDSEGRVLKTSGAQIAKTDYDRVGRAVRRYTIAKTDDSVYTDADDVTGDHVLTQTVTMYAGASDNALATVTIDRFHDDGVSSGTTGDLDTNADADDLLLTAANIKGRAQITAMWYDSLDRVTDTVAYGTYNAANWDRDGLSVPARSDTALVTSGSYDDAGRRKDTTDPRAQVSRTEYDDAGRVITTISNYVNGTPSGPTGADDVFTRFVYTDGHKTRHWLDIDGDNVEDAGEQVTIYTFGVTKGAGSTDSTVSRGDLLFKVQYPDSAGGSDVVTFAYNAQGQQIARTDQAGNITVTDIDTAGRKTNERVTTLVSGFDGEVRQIVWAYDSLGRVSTVGQTDSAASAGAGAVLDQVKYTYDGWGQVATFEQDPNSAVGTGSDDMELRFTYARATPSGGWETLRQTDWKLYHDATERAAVSYEYLSTGGLADDSVSRVSRVKVGSTAVAEYDYLGAGMVVGIDYPQVDIMSERFSPTPGTYPDLDRFNRVIKDRWTRDLSTGRDIYSVDLSYDRNSNITWAEDNIYAGRDVLYTMDGLDRVADADEGTRSGGSIASRTRREQWTLSQAGNWATRMLDLDGDGAHSGAGELNDSGT
ncbi:MAG TPA: hypothetical protein DEB06_01565, partial [Phycisphaerales bacterium]|nr:hypothetical protein [Phycisphaerales bacterium]